MEKTLTNYWTAKANTEAGVAEAHIARYYGEQCRSGNSKAMRSADGKRDVGSVRSQ